MSESIHAGYLPLWNPYINFGFPQYGDMSGGYWSPITWLIAATTGYNAYTFTLEVLLYILLGCTGMYKLTGIWKMDKNVRAMASIAFMCCGYTIGHLQHFNWLSGAAFLPWCFWSYFLLVQKISVKNILQATLLFYFLVASAHPGIIISAAYFFMAVLFFLFFKNDDKLSLKKRIKNYSVAHIALIAFFLLLAAGMITGYLDILPFFVRGEKISLANSLLNPTNVQSWVSVLFPFATVKDDAFFNTDPSMRNCYFSLPLLLFFLYACVNKKNAWQKFLLITGILFALLSTGGMFKIFAYKFIPLIGYVRLNGEFRIFSLFCFIIIAAIALNNFIQQKNKFQGSIKWIWHGMEIITASAIIFGLYKTITSSQSVVFNLSNIIKEPGISLKLKSLLNSFTFYDTFWLQGLVQLFILRGIKWCLKYSSWNLLKKLLVADMIIASLLNIPFTGTGKASVAAVQQVLNKSPKGIPAPAMKPIKNIDTLPLNEKELIGDWSMYNKQIGVVNEVPYPIILKNMSDYFVSLENNSDSNFLDKPFIFTTGANYKNIVQLKSFSPNKIDVSISADTATKIVLQQNFYPHWFYKNEMGKRAVEKESINFMSAPVKKGQSNITFTFEPTSVKYAMLISAVVFIIYCLLFLIFLFKPPCPSSRLK